jgi:hypothetical protein
MVSGNRPVAFEKTAGTSPKNLYGDPSNPETLLKKWDSVYKKRTRQCGDFLACKPLFLELNNPPIITPGEMLRIFQKIPATRTPPTISEDAFQELLKLTPAISDVVGIT